MQFIDRSNHMHTHPQKGNAYQLLFVYEKVLEGILRKGILRVGMRCVATRTTLLMTS